MIKRKHEKRIGVVDS